MNARRRLANARRAMTTARVRAAVAGRARLPAIDLEHDANGAVDALVRVIRPLRANSSLLWWAREELTAQGATREVLNGLAGPSDAIRIRSARLAGCLRMEEAVPGLGRLLAHRNGEVQAAAARALGVLRGARSADALVRALYWRRGATMRVVLELARAAPDHYLEAALLNPNFFDVRQYLAVAIGLRGARSSIPALLVLHSEGQRSERTAASRALGWVGDRSVLPALLTTLDDDWWQVRVAAVKALIRIGDPSCVRAVEPLLADRYADVRKTAAFAVRHFGHRRGGISPVAVGGWS